MPDKNVLKFLDKWHEDGCPEPKKDSKKNAHGFAEQDDDDSEAGDLPSGGSGPTIEIDLFPNPNPAPTPRWPECPSNCLLGRGACCFWPSAQCPQVNCSKFGAEDDEVTFKTADHAKCKPFNSTCSQNCLGLVHCDGCSRRGHICIVHNAAQNSENFKVCQKPRLCPEYSYHGETDNENFACIRVTKCQADEYEIAAPTAYSDRKCAKLTVCDTSYQYISKSETETEDRECSDLTECTVGEEYELTPPALRVNRVCAKITACKSDEYEVRAPTETADRICAPLNDDASSSPAPTTEEPSWTPEPLPQVDRRITCPSKDLTIPPYTLPAGHDYILTVVSTAPNGLSATDSATICIKEPKRSINIRGCNRNLPHAIGRFSLYATVRDAPYTPNIIRWDCCEKDAAGDCQACPAPFTDLTSVVERNLDFDRPANLFPVGKFYFTACYKDVCDEQHIQFRQSPIPVVRIMPLRGRVFVSDPITLYGTVSAQGPYTVQWYRGGQPIPGATNRRYVIPANTLEAKEFYRYTLIASVGPLQGEASITVQPLPELTGTCDVKALIEGGHIIAKESEIRVTTDGFDTTASLQFRYGWKVGGRYINFQPYDSSPSATTVAPLLPGNPGSATAEFFVGVRYAGDCKEVTRVYCSATVYANTMSSQIMMATQRHVLTGAVTDMDFSTITEASSTLYVAAQTTNDTKVMVEARNDVVEALYASVTPNSISTRLSASAKSNVVGLLAGLPMKKQSTEVSGCDDACTRRVQSHALSLVETVLKTNGPEDPEALDTTKEGEAVLGVLNEIEPQPERAVALKELSKRVAADTQPGTSFELKAGADIVAAASYGPEDLDDNETAVTVASSSGSQMELPLDIKFGTSVTQRSVISMGLAESDKNDFGDNGLSTNEKVTSKVVEFNINVDGQTIDVQNLPIPIKIHLPAPPPAAGQVLKCMYYENTTKSWVSNGVRAVGYNTVKKAIICESTHLSTFAGVAIDPVPETTAAVTQANANGDAATTHQQPVSPGAVSSGTTAAQQPAGSQSATSNQGTTAQGTTNAATSANQPTASQNQPSGTATSGNGVTNANQPSGIPATTADVTATNSDGSPLNAASSNSAEETELLDMTMIVAIVCGAAGCVVLLAIVAFVIKSRRSSAGTGIANEQESGLLSMEEIDSRNSTQMVPQSPTFTESTMSGEAMTASNPLGRRRSGAYNPLDEI